jgi:antitoxin ParD1/3/4
MQTMNISLPEPLKQFVEDQVSGGGYSSTSEYVRELVRADQQRKIREQLEETLLAAMRSGHATELTPQRWEELRQRLQDHATSREPDGR